MSNAMRTTNRRCAFVCLFVCLLDHFANALNFHYLLLFNRKAIMHFECSGAFAFISVFYQTQKKRNVTHK